MKMPLKCRFPAGRVSDGAALIMRAIAESGATAAAPMREVALSEGAVLHHLYVGLSARVCPVACCHHAAITNRLALILAEVSYKTSCSELAEALALQHCP